MRGVRSVPQLGRGGRSAHFAVLPLEGARDGLAALGARRGDPGLHPAPQREWTEPGPPALRGSGTQRRSALSPNEQANEPVDAGASRARRGLGGRGRQSWLGPTLASSAWRLRRWPGVGLQPIVPGGARRKCGPRATARRPLKGLGASGGGSPC